MTYSKDNPRQIFQHGSISPYLKMGLVSQPHRMNSIKAQKTNSLFK